MQHPLLHPIEEAHRLTSTLRYWLQDPKRILKPYVKPKMWVLDLGCGPGFFTIALAEMVGEQGLVVAADVQKGMLDILNAKLERKPHLRNILVHQSSHETLHLHLKFDFILAFYSLHEMIYLEKIASELKQRCHDATLLLVAEQKFHVPRRQYHHILNVLLHEGFKIMATPSIFLSRAALLTLQPSA